MNRKEALEIISAAMYSSYEELSNGLPEGHNSEWGYDEQLVIEIAEAVTKWQKRQDHLKDPYVVWYFDGNNWSKVTAEKYQEQAYKDWYTLTQGGKVFSKPEHDTYYYLGSSKLILTNRHSPEELAEEDNFSIGYLLNKTFG